MGIFDWFKHNEDDDEEETWSEDVDSSSEEEIEQEIEQIHVEREFEQQELIPSPDKEDPLSPVADETLIQNAEEQEEIISPVANESLLTAPNTRIKEERNLANEEKNTHNTEEQEIKISVNNMHGDDLGKQEDAVVAAKQAMNTPGAFKTGPENTANSAVSNYETAQGLKLKQMLRESGVEIPNNITEEKLAEQSTHAGSPTETPDLGKEKGGPTVGSINDMLNSHKNN